MVDTATNNSAPMRRFGRETATSFTLDYTRAPSTTPAGIVCFGPRMAITTDSSLGASDRRRERLDAGLYFTGTLLQRATLFIALPLLLQRLSTAEYGAFGLLQSALNLLAPVVSLNLPATATRLYFDGATDADRHAIATRLSVLSTCFGLAGGALVWLCILAGRGAMASLLGLPEHEAFVAATLVVVGALGSNHLQMAWSLWRARNFALHTAVATVIMGGLFVGLVAMLAHTRRLDVVTAMAAYAGATALVGVVANILAVSGTRERGPVSYTALAGEALRY